jgi:4-amino-4-deoxy-L-arabinose transferase-like glycosyltransferase
MKFKPRLGAWSSGQSAALLIILLLATATRMFGLGDQSLWYDEADRIFIASLPLRHLFHTMAEETLGYLPLFFLVTKPLTHPFHETTVRYPSVVCGVLTVAFIAQAGRKLMGRRGGLVAALLLTMNPFHIWFSRDANFYALLALSVAAVSLKNICFLERPTPRSWIGLTLLTGVGFWSHYFAFAIPVVEFVYLLVTWPRYYRVLRMWTLAQIIAFIPLLPWYIFVIRRGEYHIASAAHGSPHPVELLYSLWNYSVGYTEKVTPTILISLGLFLGALVLGTRQASKRQSPVLLFFWLPVGVTFLMSYRLSMYVDRYLIGVLPPFLILVSWGALKLPRSFRGVWIAGLILVSTLGTARIYYDMEYYAKEDWRGVAAHIQAQERPGDAIMPLLYQSLTPLVGQYYHGELPFEPLVVQDLVRSPSDLAEKYQRLWYIAPHFHDSTHLLARCQPFDLYIDAEDEQVRRWLMDHQHQLVQRVDLTCVSVLLYDLTSG